MGFQTNRPINDRPLLLNDFDLDPYRPWSWPLNDPDLDR